MILAEYVKLKEEQSQRIGIRDHLLYLQLTLVGGLAAAVLSLQINVDALLVGPWVAFVLGRTYLANDRKISKIGDYIGSKLEEQAQVALGGDALGDPGGVCFGWEGADGRSQGRAPRRLTQLAVDLLAFPVSGGVCLILPAYLAANRPDTGSDLLDANARGWMMGVGWTLVTLLTIRLVMQHVSDIRAEFVATAQVATATDKMQSSKIEDSRP